MNMCSRCKRLRQDKYLTRQTKWGKIKIRCKARSVCSSIARRKNLTGRRG